MKECSKEIHTPRYVVRRRAVQAELRRLPRGRFLEIGCGRGEMLPMFRSYGFTGYAVEISDSVIALAKETAERLGPDVQVVESLEQLPATEFDYLFSFEVLEHIEDDSAELAKWVSHLKPGGRALISVPARMKLWSAADTSVGHVRRYERDELISLLENAGLRVLSIATFGYPLVLITRSLRHVYHRLRPPQGSTDLEKTLESSKDSTLDVPKPLRSVARWVLSAGATLFYYLGVPLRRTNFGDGYVVVAEREPQ